MSTWRRRLPPATARNSHGCSFLDLAPLKNQHAVELVHFHTPEAASFFRAHQPEKFGDDLTASRFTVVEVNKTKKPVAGIEFGAAAGFGIRGVVPVNDGGKHVGTLEVGVSFGKTFLDQFKSASHSEVAILLKKDSGFDLFGSTYAQLPSFSPDELNAALSGASRPAVAGDCRRWLRRDSFAGA